MKNVRAVIGASGTRDGAEAPTYAVFDVDAVLMATLGRLTFACKEHSLTEARVTNYPAWGPGGIEEELRLQNGELVVLPDGTFRFADSPRDGGYIIQTSNIDVSALRAKFDSAMDGEVIFLTDQQYVREYYEEDYGQEA